MSKIVLISFIIIGSAIYIWNSKVNLNQITKQNQQIEIMLNKELIFRNIDGDETPLKNHLNHKYVLIHFWATWCGPCEAEFPELIKFSQKFSNQMDTLFVAVNDQQNDVKKFLKRFSDFNSGLILFDQSSIHQNNFGIYKLPETLLFDQDKGKIVKRFVGPQNWDSEYFAQVVQSLQ